MKTRKESPRQALDQAAATLKTDKPKRPPPPKMEFFRGALVRRK